MLPKKNKVETRGHGRSTLRPATGVAERVIQLAQRLTPKRYGFSLTKTEFRDGLAFRHGLEPKNISASCLCGENYNLVHELHCAKPGYTHMRHNKIHETANLMKNLCFDVEPKLQSLKGEFFVNRTTATEYETSLDIKATGLENEIYSYVFRCKNFESS